MAVVVLLVLCGGAGGAGREEAEAERLVVTWAAGTFRLRTATGVAKRLPRAAALPAAAEGGPERAAEAVAGFWYELRSCAGAVLYRRAMRDPRVAVVEWVETGPEGTPRIARAEAPRREAVFALTVPRHPEGCEVVLRGPAERAGRARGGVRELARLRLRAVAGGGAP